jgi:hypothetical protein
MNKTPSPIRRKLLCSLAGGTTLSALGFPVRLLADSPLVTVWKSPTCGCCVDWIVHLEENGFQVERHDVGNSEARARLGMPARLGSCHTAEVGGYAIEGHVPAREILRLLDEQPEAIGLTVPAMPRGSPGMDGPHYGDVVDPYDVLLVGVDGTPVVYQSYR